MLGGWRLQSSPDSEHRAWTGAATPAAPHLEVRAACFCRWPARGCWEEGVPAAGGAASRVAGVRAPTHGRGIRCGRVHSARPGTCRRSRGHVVAGGDLRRRRGRESCPRTRGLSPAGRRRTRPRGMSPPAYVMRSPQVAAEARDPRQSRRPPVRNCRESGWMTWIPIHTKDPCDKPDLFLVHLTGVQGSGILCGNRSTSYCGRRISDRSGRPSVAVHQSNRQGRS